MASTGASSSGSMADLLSAFDPLHSSGGSRDDATARSQPLFPPATAAHPATTTSSVYENTMRPTGVPVQHTSVSLSQQPLDLLSFDDSPSAQHSALPQPSTSALSNDPRQSRAAQRQSQVLEELQQAEQLFDLPESTSANAEQTVRHRQQPRPSAGFSPPRRMSRSGLMHDEHHPPSSIGTHHARHHQNHSQSSHSDRSQPAFQLDGRQEGSGGGAFASYTPNSDALISPVALSAEPSELFHPSSPPAGATLDSMRHSSYFNSIGHAPSTSVASNGKQPGQHSGPSHQQRPRRTSSSDRQAQKGLNDLNTGSIGPSAIPHLDKKPSRTAFTPSSFFSSPAPFSSPTLKQTFSPKASQTRLPAQSAQTSSTIPALQPPPLNSTGQSSPATGAGNVPGTSFSTTSQPSPSSPDRPKSSKKHTFDFSTFGSLGHAAGLKATQEDNGRSRHTSAPNTRTTSPASSLIIDSEPLPPIALNVPPAAESSSRVLTEDIADGIRPGLPSRIKLCKTWTLLYSLDAHGTSLTTLYSRVQAGLVRAAGGCVLVVKDMAGGIFGAYVNEAFKKSEGYYGNGECFLWKVESFPSEDDFRLGPIVRLFRWTGRNDYIVLSDGSFLSVGGGDGKFGLWVDAAFDKGFTTSCPAFRNDPLCSASLVKAGVDGHDEGKFEVMAVECWAVG